jgi:hypothetical protein
MNRELLAAASLAATVMLGGCSLQRQAVIDHGPATPEREPSADVVAFCGPNTTDPHWREQLWTLRTIGVTAVHGYCYTPPADYQVLNPGTRYATQAEYLELAAEAQRIGVGVIAYDPMFWTDPQQAAAVWAEYIADGTLVAIDLGDEPGWTDMAELNRRADLVRSAGVEPQTIFVGSGPGVMGNVLDQHAALPTACPISDDYGNNAGAMADAFALRLAAGCAGIAIDTTGRDLAGNGDRWSVDQIRRARAAGMRITLFTGVRPDNFPTWDALVDDAGRITDAGRAVREALT